MQQADFVTRNASAWERLDALVSRAGRRGVRGLAPEDVVELGRLYRRATSDLAYARGKQFDRALAAYLNRLVARAHAHVYGGGMETGATRIGRFYTQTFPREFRRSFTYVALCTAITVVSAILAYALVAARPQDAALFMPGGVVPSDIHKSLHDSNFGFGSTNSPMMASFIITNNVKVAILALAGAVTLGMFTVWIILTNGLMVGVESELFTRAGFGPDFWATIAPHGVIELTAIQIAGAAGLLIAAAVVYPGRLRRRDAIVEHARRAGVLFLGVGSMLLVAGTIEGFFSPLRLPMSIRSGFGICTGILVLLYFAFMGRDVRRETKLQ